MSTLIAWFNKNGSLHRVQRVSEQINIDRMMVRCAYRPSWANVWRNDAGDYAIHTLTDDNGYYALMADASELFYRGVHGDTASYGAAAAKGTEAYWAARSDDERKHADMFIGTALSRNAAGDGVMTVSKGDRVTITSTGAIGIVLAAWESPKTGVPMVAVSVNGHTRRYYADEIVPAPSSHTNVVR